MITPDFLILGAPKCGTSSLHFYLQQHPDICMSEPKEPFFFEAEYDLGLDHYQNTYFPHYAGESVVGEASPRNLYLPFVPPRIKESAPGAKLIVMVREPVARAYSAWWMEYSEGREQLAFPAAIRDNFERLESGVNFEGPEGERRWKEFLAVYHAEHRIAYRYYVDMGYYADQIGRYLEYFDDSRILVIPYDDLRADTMAVVQRALRFIGVDDGFLPADTSPRKVAAGALGSRLKRAFGRMGLAGRVPSGMRRLARDMLKAAGDRVPTIDAETQEMLADHFQSKNTQLSRLIDRDLTHWGT